MANPGPADKERRGRVGRIDQAAINRLVHAAARGDETAWGGLADRFSGLVWSVTRSVGLSSEDAVDVFETTWLHLVEQIGQIKDSDRIGYWLATTARREALHSLHESRLRESQGIVPIRETPVVPGEVLLPDHTAVGPIEVTVGKSGLMRLPDSVLNWLGLGEDFRLVMLVADDRLVLIPAETVPPEYAWIFTPEHLERFARALSDADERRVRALKEDELRQVIAS